MKRRIKIGVLASVITAVCVAAFVLGSRLYRAETVISVDTEMLPDTFSQVQGAKDQNQTTQKVSEQSENEVEFSDESIQVGEKASDTWTEVYVADLTRTDARINGVVTFDSKTTCVEEGFYLGTSYDNLSKNSKSDSTVHEEKRAIGLYFTMSKYGRTLKAGTKYYYKLYIIDENGNEYTSAVSYFTTYQ